MAGFRKLIIVAAATAALADASMAAAQPGPPPTPVPLAPPASDQAPVDPEQLALAKRLMALTIGQMNFGAVMKSIDTSMMDAIRKQNPKLDPAVLDRVQAATEKTMSEVMPQMMDDMAASYARHLSRQEMQDTVAFYTSPSGQAILHKLPEVMSDLGPLMAKYMPRVQRSMLESLCAENACDAQQRAALANMQSQPAR
jgi:hypothetical protein